MSKMDIEGSNDHRSHTDSCVMGTIRLVYMLGPLHNVVTSEGVWRIDIMCSVQLENTQDRSPRSYRIDLQDCWFSQMPRTMAGQGWIIRM